MIESCWASPFNQVLAREILDRLGMQDSVPGQDLEHPDLSTSVLFEATTLARYQRVLSRIAQPYRVDSRGRPTLAEFPPRGINAAAGLVSRARDLAKYDRALNDHILLRLETQELAWTPSHATTGQWTPYGLGWFVQIVDSERVVWHYGLWGGSYSSLMLKVPARRMSLILPANSDGLSASFPMAAGDVRVSPNPSVRQVGGAIAVRSSDVAGVFNTRTTLAAINAGGGVIVRARPRFAVRGDVRYFRTSFSDPPPGRLAIGSWYLHFWRGSAGLVVQF